MGSHLPISMKTANAKLNGQRRGTKQDKLKVTCTKCNKKGHYAPECPNYTANAATQQSSGESRETGTAPTAPPRQSAATLLLAGVQRGEFDSSRHVSFQFLTDRSGFALQGSAGHLPDTWILLDNQSTVDVFTNGQLLEDIHLVGSFMDNHCNAQIWTCMV